jgi:predicted TIM-barrel fold metal-dependent hydrolase
VSAPGAASDLRRALEDIRAVDHHAHLLARGGVTFDLEELLTESSNPDQISQVREHPAYLRAVRDVSTLLGVVDPDASSISAERRRIGHDRHARMLLDACGLEEMLVDDGFVFPGAMSLEDHAAFVGCGVRRIVRIEALAEASAEGWPSFAGAVERFRASLHGSLASGAAGLKTIAAYRGGLDLTAVDAAQAGAAYERWRGSGSRRLAEPALVSFFLEEALVVARETRVPLQIHTGFGDTDLVLHRSDPSLLRPLLQDPRNASVPIVLLHCYPYVRNASYLASVYPNVHLDLSLAVTFVPHRAAALLLEALDLAPATKLLFASDASRSAELFFLGATWWRDALSGALGGLVDDGVIDQEAAMRWAGLILGGNARRIYAR